MNKEGRFLYSEILLFILTFSNWIWSGAPTYVWTLNYFTIFCALFITGEIFLRKVDFGYKYMRFFYPYIIILLLVAYGFLFTDPYTTPQVTKVYFYFILTLLYFGITFASKRSWFFWLGTNCAIFYLLANVDYITLETSRNVVIGEDKKDDINSNVFGMMCILSLLNATFSLFNGKSVLIGRALPNWIRKSYYVLILSASIYSIIFATGGSRKAFILLLLSGGISILFASKLKFDAIRIILYGVLSLALTLVMGSLVYFSPFFGRVEEIFYALSGKYYEESSFDTRLLFIEEGLKVWMRSPLIGVWCGFFREWGTYAHSNYVDLLCNYGIVGLISYYSIYFNVIKKYLLHSFQQNFSLEIKKVAFFNLTIFGILILWEFAAVTHIDRYFPPLMGIIYGISIINFLEYRRIKFYRR
tara:strand:- start:4485 stop:5729 length:1245 start_codon:yes stop_codon:yes gene_type:complete